MGYTDSPNHGSELLVQFAPDFLGVNFFQVPEMESIKILLDKAKNGLLFKKETKLKLGSKIHQLAEITGIKRILLLLEILNELATTTDYEILNAENVGTQQPQYINTTHRICHVTKAKIGFGVSMKGSDPLKT